MTGEGRVVALVRDLMFASRVRSVAPGARTVYRAAALSEALGTETRLVLVDLDAPAAADAIRAVREAGTDVHVVAFGSHVETEALDAARDAGADRVMARSAFVRELPGLIRDAEGD